MQAATILSLLFFSGAINAKIPKPPVTITKCGTSFCDGDMLKVNARIGAWHVPNLKSFTAATWSATKVNYGKIVTTRPAGTSVVKFGGFCAGATKTTAFLGSIAPVGIPDPSWWSKIPAGDLDSATGDFKVGASYKIDVTLADIVNMNQMATICQNACIGTTGCKYAAYGWEGPTPGAAPGAVFGWFCKMFTVDTCSNPVTMFWSPDAPAFPVTSIGGSSVELVGFGGGCRITDTISQTAPLLNPGISIAVAPTTPFTTVLPYVQAASYTRADGIIGSIRCDVVDAGTTPGSPTFGTVWV